ncbi:hypothetical protein M9458_035803, partial [Cirrhinus mrigala]
CSSAAQSSYARRTIPTPAALRAASTAQSLHRRSHSDRQSLHLPGAPAAEEERIT